MSPRAFDRLAALLLSRSGLILQPDKHYLVEARLAPLLADASAPSLEAMTDAACAAPDGPLAAAITEAMTTNETSFFRDEHPFLDLATRVLPRLSRARPPATPIRIWSAAASFGQEAYSIAMVVAERRDVLGARRVEIVGSDLSRAVVERARAGVFSEFEIQRGLSAERRAAYFEPVAGQHWRASAALRGAVRFETHNLLADPRALGPFDVVFCRNVLLYFNRETKRHVLAHVSRALSSDGVLYLGGTETLLGLDVGLFQVPGTVCGHERERRRQAAAV